MRKALPSTALPCRPARACAGLLLAACAAAAAAAPGGSVTAGAAGTASGVKAGPATAGDARAWLARIHAAAENGNYRGTMVVSAGGLLSSSRVWHFQVGQQRYERREALDGQQQQVLRHNADVQTRWPQSRTVSVERREALPLRPGTPTAVEPRALEQYELQRQGQGRVAGRETDVFVLQPRDGLRYAQRLWADRATGLMLRADVLDPQREVLESAAFTEIEIDARPQPERVLREMRSVEGWRVLPSRKQPTGLEAEGWAVAQPVPGFTLAGCVKRPLALPPGSAADAGDEQMLQAVFSDGLTHVSVFIEPYRESRHRQELQARSGATATLALRRGDAWITAMGDVPPGTLRLFVTGLERRR